MADPVLLDLFHLFSYPYEYLRSLVRPGDRVLEVVTADDWAYLSHVLRGLAASWGQRPYAFAPIRTSPRRTYDPAASDPKPEGSHVPMLLASLSKASPKAVTAFEQQLRQFGVESGLFDQIEVIRKGKKESDPFQLGVKSRGAVFNLVDVGYGVSQALPLVVDTLQRTRTNDLFLVQQPEVHLHPRAQAELGTFFAAQSGPQSKFIIETHSDYLVDRIRLECRLGKLIKPHDVSILYFAKNGNGVTIHNIEIDRNGDITNAPNGYRQFFLDEERQLLEV